MSDQQKTGKKKARKQDVVFKSSNAFLQAKYKSTLRQNKIFTYAISQMREKSDGNGGTDLVADLSAAEIKEQFGYTGNSVYNFLKPFSKDILDHKYMLEDDTTHQFFYMNMINDVSYSDGHLVITFNKKLKPHTLDVQKNYTLVDMRSLMSFESNNTFRLYELLKIYEYLIPKEEGACYEVKIGLAELKFNLGIIDAGDEKIEKAIKSGMSLEDIDDKIAVNAKYRDYSNFRKRVLDTAYKEMKASKKATIYFEYVPITRGRGRKTIAIRFFIYRHNNHDWHVESVFDTEVIDELSAYTEGRLSRKNITTLLEKSDGNAALIKTIYNSARETNGIKNLMGWMVSAIEGQWEFPERRTEENEEPAGAATRFTNFQERDTTDYDQLMAQLIHASDPQQADAPDPVDTEYEEISPAQEVTEPEETEELPFGDLPDPKMADQPEEEHTEVHAPEEDAWLEKYKSMDKAAIFVELAKLPPDKQSQVIELLSHEN